jgi:hypothetical protein
MRNPAAGDIHQRKPRKTSPTMIPSNLFYRAHLFWRGKISIGTIAGFRFADATTP